jgi:hypothetical protein
VSRVRRGLAVDGSERDEAAAAAAAGGNAGGDLVGDRAEGLVAAGVAAREASRTSGGGVGGFGWRRLVPAASSPPKRMALPFTRRLPPVHGREPAARFLRSGREDGLRVGASTSHGGFGNEKGVLPPAALEKVVAAKGGASAADWYLHRPKQRSGFSAHVIPRDSTAGSIMRSTNTMKFTARKISRPYRAAVSTFF